MKLPSHSLLLPGLLVALSQSVAGRENFPGRIGGEGRIGQAAPPFELKAWLNADPLEPADLKGNVLLVRWWTDTCPFCSTTAPVLRELNRKYRGRGLRVIGIFHRRCCTARSKSLTSLCRLQSHPAQYVSGIPSAAILLSISHPIRCSTRCLANVRARISGPMSAL